jgi:hypothetical protein
VCGSSAMSVADVFFFANEIRAADRQTLGRGRDSKELGDLPVDFGALEGGEIWK